MKLWSKLTFGNALFICLAILCVAIAAMVPNVELPINDDFSYTRVAQLAAQTGRLIYSGWGSPIVGLQAYWAAIFIKIFGFSFNVVRLSVIPFTLGCGALLLSLFHRAGVNPITALFGVLSILLSPVVLPLEPTFMTDITSLFFVLLTIWCAEHAVHSTTEPRRLQWMMGTALSGVGGASIRQTVTLALVTSLFFIAWHTVKRRQVLSVLAVLAISLACVQLLNSWYALQPYGVPLPIFDTASFRGYRLAVYNLVANCIQLPFLLLSALFLALPIWRKFPLYIRVLLAGSAPAVAGLLWYAWHAHPRVPKLPFGPMIGNLVTQWGLLGQGGEILGEKPLILRTWLQAVLIGITAAAAAATLFSLVTSTARLNLSQPLKSLARKHSVLALLLLFACTYFPLVLLRLYVALSFDRYLIPFFPPIVLLICMLPGVRQSSPHPVAWLVLLAACLFGVGTTHDYFSESRARLIAARAIMESGAPRTSISAGFEYDMWTQLETSRYINDAMISTPPDAYRPVDLSDSPLKPPYWGWNFTPAIHPRYILVLSHQEGLQSSSLPAVPFSRWLSADGNIMVEQVSLQGLH